MPYAASPLDRSEMDRAAEEIQENYYLLRSLRHAQELAQAVARHDIPRLDRLNLNSPSRLGDQTQQSAVDLSKGLFDSLVSGGTKALQPQSTELKPLNLLFGPNTILTIGAGPGSGKSALLEQILLDITDQGGMALDITIENTANARSQRYLQHLAGPRLGPSEWLKQEVEPQLALPAMERFMWLTPPKNGNPGVARRLYVEGSVSTLEGVVGTIKAFLENYRAYVAERTSAGYEHPGPPVVAIDFLQQMAVEDHRLRDSYQQQLRILETLYRLSKEHGIAMIWLSQLNKAAQGGKFRGASIQDQMPKLAEMEGAGRLGQYSHAVMLLYRPADTYHHNGHTKVYYTLPKVRAGAIQEEPNEALFTGARLTFDFDEISIKSKL